jgi:DNA-binding GntR family transcriptional regulator
MLLDSSRFAPGEKLSVEMISRELGVSRSPVWSAIARLDAEGLVDVSPRQGVYLVAFDEKRLRALFETREALEGMATRLAASRMTELELDALGLAVKQQKKLLSDRFEADFAAAALDFHEKIVSGAGNPLIERQLSGIYARTNAMCRGRDTPRTTKILTANYKDHCEILKALRRRDENAAEELARFHVRRLMATVLPAPPVKKTRSHS